MDTNHSVNDFMQFVWDSPTAFHATAKVAECLINHGYTQLNETDSWTLSPGGHYFVCRNQSSLLAFIIPKKEISHFQIVSSHSDSPMLKLKTNFESPAANSYLRLNAEVYGGMIDSTWLDRPLSIAGRVVVKNGSALSTILVNLDENTVLIPNMPIHFNREINDGYKFNPQNDLLPLFGDVSDSGILMQALADIAKVSPEQIVASDLFVYNRTPGTIWGSHKQFFSCPRIDDLECAYTSLKGFLQTCSDGSYVPVFALFDNEEVGSRTKQGADSTFLSDTISRIVSAIPSQRSLPAILASSFMVSADNAHAVHPNHPEKYDDQNRVYMNRGIVIKHNARQKYTTDAISDAVFSEICHAADIPVQHFSNRSDILGGSTLGNIANAHVSMNTVDIGAAQLAMHSSYETAGCLDLPMMIEAFFKFYSTAIINTGNGNFNLN